MLGEVHALGAHLVAISPQTVDASRVTAEENGLTFHVLSDAGNEVARRFHLAFSLPEDLREIYDKFGFDLPGCNGDDSYELPLAAAYVIGKDGVIRAAHLEADYVKRMEPDDILAALRALK